MNSQTARGEFDLLDKIKAKILEEDSLITKYYRQDTDSILGIIDQLQPKRTTAISTIITKVKDPEIYGQFPKDQNDPIGAIITKILEEDTKIDSQFKTLFKDDPDLIKKIITEVVKENAIKKIIAGIKDDASRESQTVGDEFDLFEKIIAKILKEDSLITKYYKEDPYSIVGIIDQLQTKKADENPIQKITTRILIENAKASKALQEDPLVQILIKHKKETSEKILSAIDKSKIKKEAKIVKGEITLDKYTEIPKIEHGSKTSFFSNIAALFKKKQGNTSISDKSIEGDIEGDVVFVKLNENLDAPTEEDIKKSIIKEAAIEIKKAEEELAEKEKKGKDLEVKRLLLYAELIDKIPEQYSESISSIHQEIITLKKQEKDHKKTLDFLTPLIKKEEEEQKRIAEEEAKRIAEAEAKRVAEEEAKRIAEAEAQRVAEVEAKRVAEEQKSIETEILHGKIEEIKELENTISQKEQDLIRTKTYIESNIREILSTKYIDQRLASDPEKSIMDQFIDEAIIVDEAKKQLTYEEIDEIYTSQPQSDNTSLEAFNLLIIKKALEKHFKSEQEAMGISGEDIVIDVLNINTNQNIIIFLKTDNQLHESFDELRRLEDEGENDRARLALIKTELGGKLAHPTSELSSTATENDYASWVERHLASLRGEEFAEVEVQLPEQAISSSNKGILGLQDLAGEPFAETPYNLQKQIASAVLVQEFVNLETPPPPPPLLETWHHQPWEKLGSAPLQNYPPSLASQNQFQASSIIPSLELNEVLKNVPTTILRTKEEKKKFWQTFISTRLKEKPLNSNQSSPRTIDEQEELVENQSCDQPQSNPMMRESDNDIILPNTISSISYLTSEIEEIEERKKILYTILQNNLIKNLTNQRSNERENKNTIDPSNTEYSNEAEDPKEEIIDTNVTKTNIEIVMNHIATSTSNLAPSILKVKNGQEEAPEASDPESQQSQSVQNPLNADPIIYSGIGIRIKLENKNEECFLNITEVFENSGLDQGDVNKKITHIECEGNLKLISDIYKECENDDEKFYTKIAVIFRDPNKETLKLKINNETEQRDVKKNIFIPSQRNIFNISDNSQLTKIAEQINARRTSQNFTPLSSPRYNKEATI